MPRFKYDMNTLKELEKSKLAKRWPAPLNRDYRNEEGFWDPHRAFGMPLQSNGNGSNGTSISPQSSRNNSDPKNTRSDSSYSSSGHANRHGASRERDRKPHRDLSSNGSMKVKNGGSSERIRSDVISLGPQKTRGWAEGCHVSASGEPPSQSNDDMGPPANPKRNAPPTMSSGFTPSGDTNSHNSIGNSSYNDRDNSTGPRNNYHPRGPTSSYYDGDSYGYKGSGSVRGGRGRPFSQESQGYNVPSVNSSSSSSTFPRNGPFGRGSAPRYNGSGFNPRGGYSNYNNMSNANYHGRWDNSYRRGGGPGGSGPGGRFDDSRTPHHNNPANSKEPEWLTDGPENVGETIELHGIHEDDATMRKFKRCEQASSLTSRDEKASDRKIRKTFDPAEKLFMELEGQLEEFENESDDTEAFVNGSHKGDLVSEGLDEFEEPAWLLEDPLMKPIHKSVLPLDVYVNDPPPSEKLSLEKDDFQKPSSPKPFHSEQPFVPNYPYNTFEENRQSNASLFEYSSTLEEAPFEMKSYRDEFYDNEIRLNTKQPNPPMPNSRTMRSELLSIIRGLSSSNPSPPVENASTSSTKEETNVSGKERNAMETFLKQIILKNSANESASVTQARSMPATAPPVSMSCNLPQEARENTKEHNFPTLPVTNVKTLEEIEKQIIHNNIKPKHPIVNKPSISQQTPITSMTNRPPFSSSVEAASSMNAIEEREQSSAGKDCHTPEPVSTSTANNLTNTFPYNALSAPPFVPRQQTVPSAPSPTPPQRQILSQYLSSKTEDSAPTPASSRVSNNFPIGNSSVVNLAKHLQQLKLYQQQQQLLARLAPNVGAKTSAPQESSVNNQPSSTSGFNPAAAAFVPRASVAAAAVPSSATVSASSNMSPPAAPVSTPATSQRNVASPSFAASSTNETSPALSAVQIQNLLRAMRSSNASEVNSSVPIQSGQRTDVSSSNYMLAAAAAAVAANQCGSNTYRWIKAMSNAISASNRITQIQHLDSPPTSNAPVMKSVPNASISPTVSPTMNMNPTSDSQAHGIAALSGSTMNNPILNSPSVPISSRPTPKPSAEYTSGGGGSTGASYLEPICSHSTRQIIQQQQQQYGSSNRYAGDSAGGSGNFSNRPILKNPDDEHSGHYGDGMAGASRFTPHQRHPIQNNSTQFHQILNMLQRSRVPQAAAGEGNNPRMSTNVTEPPYGSSGYGRPMVSTGRQNIYHGENAPIRGTNFNNNASLLGSPSAAGFNSYSTQSANSGNSLSTKFLQLMQQQMAQQLSHHSAATSRANMTTGASMNYQRDLKHFDETLSHEDHSNAASTISY